MRALVPLCLALLLLVVAVLSFPPSAPDLPLPEAGPLGPSHAAQQAAAPHPPVGPAGHTGPAAPGPSAAAPPSLSSGPRLTLTYNAPRAEGLGDQCTAYALDRLHEATGLWLRSRGHAGQWGQTAREAGWSVGAEPAPRAILVMPPADGHRYALYTGGALSRAPVHPEYGHVGWVERLDGTGNWALISDQNWKGDGARGARWVWLRGAPLQFIYSDR